MTLIRIPIEMTTEGRDLSDAAFRTFIELCAWSMQGLLDGAIPIRDVPRLANTADPDAAITELVDRGWIVERGDSLRLVHHAQLLFTRKQVEARRESDRKRQNKRRTQQNTYSVGDSSQLNSTQGSAVTHGVTHGVTGDEWDE